MTDQPARIGILTVSDRASTGVYEDKGGPAIKECLSEILSREWEAVPRLIPDEQPTIERTLCELSDVENCCLIVTTGGTGLTPRDVTPQATKAIVDYEVPGMAEAMRAAGRAKTPFADLSRGVVGTPADVATHLERLADLVRGRPRVVPRPRDQDAERIAVVVSGVR